MCTHGTVTVPWLKPGWSLLRGGSCSPVSILIKHLDCFCLLAVWFRRDRKCPGGIFLYNLLSAGVVGVCSHLALSKFLAILVPFFVCFHESVARMSCGTCMEVREQRGQKSWFSHSTMCVGDGTQTLSLVVDTVTCWAIGLAWCPEFLNNSIRIILSPVVPN